MKLKYVGVKNDGETAFSRETGLTWMPGDVHEVADKAIAVKMLNHPDVFALANEPAIPIASATLIAVDDKFVAPATIQLPDGSQLVLDGMDKEALHKLAKDMEVAVHHNAGAAKVIEVLQAAFPVKSDEAE